jgi:hypothetical protein
VQAFADQGFTYGRRGWRELDVTFGDDAEASCKLNERESVVVVVGGVRVRAESELGGLEVCPFERLGRMC